MKTARKTAGGAASGNITILLVDDNVHGMIARRKVLEEQGYLIQTASSGEEALQIFPRHPFDLMVTDFRMPGIDGVELISRLRALHVEIPVILLSGFVEPLGMTEESTGADAVLSKCAGEAAHLVRAVQRLLSRGRRKPLATEKRPGTVYVAKSV
ncbi:MAG: response regulator [Acidobacteriota bacterium]|nr:response regulator [Acidobacteriota bacterium]